MIEIYNYLFCEDVADLILKKINKDLFGCDDITQHVNLHALQLAAFITVNKIYYSKWGYIGVKVRELDNDFILFEFFISFEFINNEKVFSVKHPTSTVYNKGVISDVMYYLNRLIEKEDKINARY